MHRAPSYLTRAMGMSALPWVVFIIVGSRTSPAEAASPVVPSCAAALQKWCEFVKSDKTKCLSCIITNDGALRAAGCTGADETQFCGSSPTPPPPVPPPPPPHSSCVDWLFCEADDDHPDACNGAEKTIIAGHQCEGCPRGPGGNYTDATPEAVCIAVGSDGNSTMRAGHDNLIPRDRRPFGDWGCIFNSGPANCGSGVGHGCNNRDGFKEFRAVQKAGTDPVRWILSAQGYEVPAGAVHIGAGRVVARTLSANSNQGNIIPGFCETTGGVDGVGGKLGALYYDDNSDAAHPTNQWNATDFEIACCGSDADCKPKPPAPGHYTHPWVRFAHAIPDEHQVDCVVTLQGEKKTWSQYKFGRFSPWAGHFNASNGNGLVEIYENVNGKRGALLANATRFMPPGPVLITIKGTWPPVSDTPTALGSIEAIANSFTKPANGNAEVRLL